MRKPAILVALALICVVGATPADAAPRRSFYGIQDWSAPSQQDFKRLRKARVGTLRTNLTWSEVEPVRGMRNWAPFDLLMRRAARARITVAPTLIGSPSFAARRPQYPPVRRKKGYSAWLRFVRDAVNRYGRGGRFWKQNRGLPRRPVKAWMVWNEPNFPVYWFNKPRPREYVRFLRKTRRRIKKADRRAKIVLAGLPETKNGMPMRRFLRRVYRVRWARKQFDVVAIHPYARNHRGVVGAVRRARRVMRRSRDRRTPIWVTEVGWATGGKVSRPTRKFKTSRRGQAKRLRKTFRRVTRLRRKLRVGMIVWFSLRDRAPAPGEPNWWAIHTGLFTRDGDPKPAWRAFRRFTRRAR